MARQIFKWRNNKYSQNYILKNPFSGALIFLLFCLGFMLIYEPLKGSSPHIFSYAGTMAVYCFAGSIVLFCLIKGLKIIKYFCDEKWTFAKEIISIAIILSVMSIILYLLGFIFEPPAPRWNIPTFLDACKSVFLICIIPFVFFNLLNYRHLFLTEKLQDFESANDTASTTDFSDKLIQISSRLKKEELSFYPKQFLYAESDGNYVVFHLNVDNQIRKKIIRNSINDIEKQLSAIPYFIRTHRAFIVNITKVSSQKGNTLGYRLILSGMDAEIPVSRQNTRRFNQLIRQYH